MRRRGEPITCVYSSDAAHPSPFGLHGTYRRRCGRAAAATEASMAAWLLVAASSSLGEDKGLPKGLFIPMTGPRSHPPWAPGRTAAFASVLQWRPERPWRPGWP
jgi:hypothetical protein